MLSIRVQPADAVILIDGERWDASGAGPLQVQVTPGPHRVEVQKDGYQPFSSTVQVRSRESDANQCEFDALSVRRVTDQRKRRITETDPQKTQQHRRHIKPEDTETRQAEKTQKTEKAQRHGGVA